MAKIDSLLEEGEVLLSRSTRHWIIFITPMVMVLLSFLLWFRLLTAGQILAPLAGLFFMVMASWLLMIYLRERVEDYLVTNRRVINRRGIIRKHLLFFPLDRIDTFDVYQGAIGRFLNFGTFHLHTSAGSHGSSRRDYIKNPDEWRKQVSLAIEAMRLNPNPVPQENDPGESKTTRSVADRLKELDELFKKQLITRKEFNKKRKEILGGI